MLLFFFFKSNEAEPKRYRRVIYTTHAVESVYRQLRKVTKNKAVFPTDESLIKMLFFSSA